MQIVIKLSESEYEEYMKNADATSIAEADMFILDSLSEHAGVLIYDAEIRVISDAVLADPTREKRS